MRVKTNAPELLIIEDRPWLIGVLIAGAVLGFAIPGVAALLRGEIAGLLYLCGSAASMVFFHLFVRRTQAVFHASGGWVEIRQRSLARYTAQRHDLDAVERAVVESSTDSDGGDTYRVTLVLAGSPGARRVPVTQVYSGGRGAQSCAAAINAWLDSVRQGS